MSTNISKLKREDLLNKIKAIRGFIAAAPQDENTGNLLSYLSDLEKDVGGKKYGLIFEEHREGIDELLKTHTPVLTEDKDLFIDNGGQMNFLIEGDNLAALKLLEKTHKGKIDFIYIDPPYNTGKKNDEQGGFIYDDAFVDENDMFIHSKWLSFMDKRLKVAKKLLSKDGIIFISIGKEENASLRILCDEIFGDKNILGQIVRRTKTTSFRGNYFALRLDYILCYCGGNVLPKKFMDVTDKSKYTKIETEGRYKGEAYKDDTAFYLSTLETRPNQRYWIKCPDGELVIPPGETFPIENDDAEKVFPVPSGGRRTVRLRQGTPPSPQGPMLSSSFGTFSFPFFPPERRGHIPPTWMQPRHRVAFLLANIGKTCYKNVTPSLNKSKKRSEADT